MASTNIAITHDIEIENNSVAGISKQVHDLPSGVQRHPESRPDPLVEVVDTDDPPPNPVFAVQAADRSQALKLAHTVFEDLAVSHHQQHSTTLETYRRVFAYWLFHYTPLQLRESDTLTGVVGEITEGRHTRDGRTRYVHNRVLHTTPYLVHVGQEWRGVDGY